MQSIFFPAIAMAPSTASLLMLLAAPAVAMAFAPMGSTPLSSMLRSHSLPLAKSQRATNAPLELNMARQPFIAGNWKMNPTSVDEVSFHGTIYVYVHWFYVGCGSGTHRTLAPCIQENPHAVRRDQPCLSLLGLAGLSHIQLCLFLDSPPELTVIPFGPFPACFPAPLHCSGSARILVCGVG